MKVNMIGKSSFGELRKTIIIEEAVKAIDKNENFIVNLTKEVKRNPAYAKKLINALSKTGMMLNSWLVLATPIMAKTSLVSPDIIVWGKILISTVFIMGLIIALITLLIAGISKMVLKREFGEKWRKDILAGLRDMILAPLILSLAVALTYYFAESIPFFNNVKTASQEVFGILFKK